MTNQTPESVIAEVIEYHADTIGTHYEGCYKHHAGCLAVRLRYMLREPGVPDAATEELESTIYPDYEGLTAAVFERSHEPAFSDDSGGLREARAFAESLVEKYIDQQGMKQLKAERDDALAAIERARAIHRNAGQSQGYDSRFKGGYGMLGDCCAACGSHGEYGVEWPCPTVAALDGAPEPEEKP